MDIREITSEQLEQEIEKNRYKIIDVREDEEVQQGMIPTAIHIPLGELPERLDELSKDDEYVLVCRSGARSYNASLFLADQGYNVINLKGGMLDWKGEKVF